MLSFIGGAIPFGEVRSDVVMLDFSTGRYGAKRKQTWLLLLAMVLAPAVFTIDTFTEIESAIAVLYVLVLLLAADEISRRGVIALAAICGGLTLLSFFINHGQAADLSSILRCVVSLAAIVITTAILLRDKASRQGLWEANMALTRSERRYRSIFEQSRFSLWEQDFSRVKQMLSDLRARGVTDLAAYVRTDGEFPGRCADLIATLDVNEATVELLGATSRADVVGSMRRFLPADNPGLMNVLAAIFEGRDRVEGKGRMIAADGRELTVLFGMTFPDDDRDFNRVVVALVDVTQRELTQQALHAAQAELGRASRVATVGMLSASLAHEINQPLGALVMNAQTCLRWLRRDPPDLESAVKAAERTVQGGKRVSEIVQQTRAMLVKGVRDDEEVDLRQLVEEVSLLLEHELSAAAVSLRLDFALELPPLRSSRVELQQVLVNLIANGLEAMRDVDVPLREIAVTADRPDAGHVRVSVRDRGAGLSEENARKLFDPFFTTKAEGMGMGLAICRSTIEARGGRIAARNHAEGGAIFEFILPVGRDLAQQTGTG
jgi:C4-dicarboxylate-specific signal transduction histidine kinase